MPGPPACAPYLWVVNHLITNQKIKTMKKLGILMAAAMLFVGASAFANSTPAKSVKQETKKEASATQQKSTHKAHGKHHAAKSKGKSTAAPKA
jgi:hypothetical protein